MSESNIDRVEISFLIKAIKQKKVAQRGFPVAYNKTYGKKKKKGGGKKKKCS